MKRRDFITTLTAAGLTSQLVPLTVNHVYAAKSQDKNLICIFSKHLQFLPDYKSMAETAAEIGFDGVDLTVRPGGHVQPENVERDLPLAVQAVRDAGLKIPMMVTRITDAREQLTEKVLKTAGESGIRYYRMGYLAYDDNLSVTDSLEKYKSNMAGLAMLNQKFNLYGAYQNHAGTRVGGPVWDLWILLKDLDPGWIGCQYDVRHATVEGGYSWPLAMKQLLPYIKTVAIKDFYWLKGKEGWKTENCMLGEGMVDFKQYFKIYKQAKLSGPISMHYEYKIFDEADSLDVKREKTISAMSKDLQALRAMMLEYGV